MGVPLLYGLYTVQHSIKIYVVYAYCHKQENQTNYARLLLTSLYFIKVIVRKKPVFSPLLFKCEMVSKMSYHVFHTNDLDDGLGVSRYGCKGYATQRHIHDLIDKLG